MLSKVLAKQFALFLIIAYDNEDFNIIWSYYVAMANTLQVIIIIALISHRFILHGWRIVFASLALIM